MTEKAKEMAEKLGKSDFNDSQGWLGTRDKMLSS